MSRARDRIAEGVGIGLALFVASCVVIALVSAGDERAPTPSRESHESRVTTRATTVLPTAPAPHATTPTTRVPARIPLRVDGECMETGLHEAEMLVKLDDARVDPKCRVKP